MTKENPEINKWIKERPTKHGLYWLYGWRFGKPKIKDNVPAELSFVELRHTGDGSPILVTRGHFLEDNVKGYWQKIEGILTPILTTYKNFQKMDNEVTLKEEGVKICQKTKKV